LGDGFVGTIKAAAIMATSMVHDQANKTSSTAVRNHGSSGNVLLEKKLFALLLGYFLVVPFLFGDVASEDLYVLF
jgi:hypothetical protein